MIDSLSDGFMSIDKTWRFVYLNDTAERYLQQEREYLLGRELWECYPELGESGYGEIYRQTAATGEARTHTAYYAPLGAWFEARSFAHDDGITVLFRDVTRDHEYAAQLEFEASHDYLTGLPNRRSCVEVLTAAVADAGDAAARSSCGGRQAHFSSQSRTSGSCWCRLRSICRGVTDTRPEATAWKSVPGPASCSPPAAPIQ